MLQQPSWMCPVHVTGRTYVCAVVQVCCVKHLLQVQRPVQPQLLRLGQELPDVDQVVVVGVQLVEQRPGALEPQGHLGTQEGHAR